MSEKETKRRTGVLEVSSTPNGDPRRQEHVAPGRVDPVAEQRSDDGILVQGANRDIRPTDAIPQRMPPGHLGELTGPAEPTTDVAEATLHARRFNTVFGLACGIGGLVSLIGLSIVSVVAPAVNFSSAPVAALCGACAAATTLGFRRLSAHGRWLEGEATAARESRNSSRSGRSQ